MPDIAALASDYETKEREAALSKIKTYFGCSAFTCSECGCEIPEARRKAIPGTTMCCECQEEKDRE